MIASLMINQMVNVSMNGSKDIEVNGHELRIDRDIPFIRYKIGYVDNRVIEYIRMMQGIFTKSVHLVELDLNEHSAEYLDMLDTSGLSVARFLYWHVDDIMCNNIEASVREYMPMIVATINKIDGLMIYDDTSVLDMVTYRKFVMSLQNTAIRRHDDFYGLCNSPFSCSEYACLTAVKARKLQAKYCTDVDVPLPTSNHQDNPTCGCIRHFIVESDIIGLVKSSKKEVKKESKKEVKETKEKKETKKKEKKGFIPYGKMF